MPSLSMSAFPRSVTIGSSISSASSQVAKRSTRSDARTKGSGTCNNLRRRFAARSTVRTMSS